MPLYIDRWCELIGQVSDEALGKNAQTVIRDKATGRKRDLNAERAQQAETDAAKAATAAKYDVWNKGRVSMLVHTVNARCGLRSTSFPCRLS